MPFSVTLNFRGDKSLLEKTDLLLAFDKQGMAGMYSIYNPVVWRVTAFPGGGGGSFQATYTVDLAFTRAQIDSGVVQPASYSTHITTQQETTLTVTSPTPPETYAFSAPVAWATGGPGQFNCINGTSEFQDIGVGFYEEGHNDPTTSLVLNNVPGGGVSAVAEFTPVVSAYVIAGFVENQIIKAQIQSALDWSLDLAVPGIQLNWVLTESSTGYKLIPDTTPPIAQ